LEPGYRRKVKVLVVELWDPTLLVTFWLLTFRVIEWDRLRRPAVR
jgi:hypothetical protein